MDSDIGNIRAVREWSRRYFYTKQDIGFFVTKMNAGLKAYALMIIGPRNKKVTINPGNYEFTLNSDGWYRYLFFFENNSEITLAIEDGDTITYQLNEYNDTINLSPWVIATPQMTGTVSPSGYVEYSYDLFNRNENDKWMTQINNRPTLYEFPEPTTIYKMVFKWTNNGYAIKAFEFEASNDYEHWVTLNSYGSDDTPLPLTYTVMLDDPKPYLYYRIRYPALHGNQNYAYIKQIYLYTVEQESTVYRIATPVMTSNTVPSGIVTSSSWRYDGEQYKCFDQADTNFQLAGYNVSEENGAWVQYQFTDVPHIIKKLIIRKQSDYGIKKFHFQGSNDGVNFTTLATGVMRHNNNLYSQPFYINNSMPYYYYRVYVTELFGDLTYWGFYNIDMYEEV